MWCKDGSASHAAGRTNTTASCPRAWSFLVEWRSGGVECVECSVAVVGFRGGAPVISRRVFVCPERRGGWKGMNHKICCKNADLTEGMRFGKTSYKYHAKVGYSVNQFGYFTTYK